MWKGRTVVILGGGPSLTQEQVDYVRGKAKVIAINNAYLLAPWADMLYFCDARWFKWHKDKSEFQNFKGLRVTLSNETRVPLEKLDIKSVAREGKEGLCIKPNTVATGANGGYQTINLCYHLAASIVILLGYDMKADGNKTHWHKGHNINSPTSIYQSNLIPLFKTLAEALKKIDMSVINCTPGSALHVFPEKKLGDVL